MFDEKTKQNLKAYVYMLIDPRTNKPFYIGKGNNNRVFDHVKCAIKDEDEQSLKYDTIRDLIAQDKVPVYVIVRHGLSDETAYHLECTLIDYSYYLGNQLTNVASGKNSIEKGLMSVEKVQSLYNAVPLKEIGDNCVIININKTYKRHAHVDSIYLATKETWKMKDPRGKITTVLSEYHGLIVEVFAVSNWYEKERSYGIKSPRAGKYIGFGFEGKVASKDIRDKYIGKSISHLKKKGAANVVRYKLEIKEQL
jgi:hypothetical protein